MHVLIVNMTTSVNLTLTNRFFALIREFGKGLKSGKSHSYWLARFNRKMSFHFPSVFPLISDRSVWHNGKHPRPVKKTSRSFQLFFRKKGITSHESSFPVFTEMTGLIINHPCSVDDGMQCRTSTKFSDQ